MKTKIILSIILFLLTMPFYSQSKREIEAIEREIVELESKIREIENRPLRPDWMKAKFRERETYFFKRITISSNDVNGKLEADRLAQIQAFQAGADYLGYHVNVSNLNNASLKGNDAELSYIDDQAEKRISTRCVCEDKVEDKQTGDFRYEYLYEISKSGKVIAKFEPINCQSRALGKKKRDELLAADKQRLEELKKSKSEKIAKARKKIDGRAFAASMFVPGLGQMLKGKGGAGTGILLSELIFAGGGTACYFIRQNQDKKMNSITTTYDGYKVAKNMKNTMTIGMYSGYGTAGIIYVFNLFQAYLIKPTNEGIHRMSFEPTLIPISEYLRPNYAMGATIKINL